MKAKNLPISYWAEAINTANYLKNISPTKVLNKKSPFEVLYEIKPNIDNLHIFGSKVLYHETRDIKVFDDRAHIGVFTGYNDSDKTYRVFNAKENRTIYVRDLRVVEDESIYTEP